MHCPTCREENAPTTRFCTSCGAVLVEEAPEGGRRRVLRPWGLRRSAPPTVSPDFPGAGAARAADAARGRRTDFWLAGSVVAAIAAGTMLYPTLRSEAGAPASRALATEPSTVVAVPSPALVRETKLAAPGLVEAAEPLPARKPARVPVPPTVATAAPLPAPRSAGVRGVPAVPAVPVNYPVPPRESVIGDGRSADLVAEALPAASIPSPAPPQVVDRWQPLRDELALCQPLGLFRRAMCEQGARLAHCDGHWGQSGLCPAVRSEYGQ